MKRRSRTRTPPLSFGTFLGNRYRGFESLPLRQRVADCRDSPGTTRPFYTPSATDRVPRACAALRPEEQRFLRSKSRRLGFTGRFAFGLGPETSLDSCA